jgi:L-ascorbate metabolism protein UlaG (beta-lactamase superfamily)
VTHVHSDHFDPDNLQKITTSNPDVKIFTTPQVVEKWGDPHARAVKAGEKQKAGHFNLRFYGKLHRAVHPDWPQDQNIGALVNGKFYYAGDSLVVPSQSVEVLAVPVSNAWLKTGEAIDYMKSIKAKTSIRTHDAPLSKAGKQAADKWLAKAGEKYGLDFQALDPGDSIEF